MCFSWPRNWFNCQRCFLGEYRCHHGGGEDIVFFEGNPDAHVLIVGEAPGEQEDLQGEPFVGQAGRLLDNMLAAIGAYGALLKARGELLHWPGGAPWSPPPASGTGSASRPT